MKLKDYQCNTIGWMLSNMIDNMEIQENGMAKIEFELTSNQMYIIAKFLSQFKNEVLKYESETINNNINKILNTINRSWQNK